jgi:hypothetical protein
MSRDAEHLTVEHLNYIRLPVDHPSGYRVAVPADACTLEQFDAWAKSHYPENDERAGPHDGWSLPERAAFCDALHQQGWLPFRSGPTRTLTESVVLHDFQEQLTLLRLDLGRAVAPLVARAAVDGPHPDADVEELVKKVQQVANILDRLRTQ